MGAVAKKLVVLALFITGVALLAPLFGPKAGESVKRAVDKSPGHFAPKWMLVDIKAIREQGKTLQKQNERIIGLLEERAATPV